MFPFWERTSLQGKKPNKTNVLVFGFNTYTKYIFLGCRSSNFIDEEC